MMRRELRGKRVIVTGASSGMGRATAAALAAAGAKVALAARSVDKLAAAEGELRGLGAEVLALPTDVTKPADRARLVEAVVGEWGGLDLLVNAAGVGGWVHFASSDDTLNRQTMETNFFAPVELTRLAVPHLTRGDQPAVVYVTSMCGRRAMPGWAEYSASKAALVGMGEALRAEFARYGIDLITVVPGLTNSEWKDHLLRAEGRADIRYEDGMTPEYVASRILDTVRRNKKEVVLGREARMVLALNRYAPRLVNRLLARKIAKLYPQP